LAITHDLLDMCDELAFVLLGGSLEISVKPNLPRVETYLRPRYDWDRSEAVINLKQVWAAVIHGERMKGDNVPRLGP
jgi:hypothetical protein